MYSDKPENQKRIKLLIFGSEAVISIKNRIIRSELMIRAV